MKRTLIIASVAALAFVGMAGTANAAPGDANCFGQVHKTVNAGGVEGFDNVGQLVQVAGGQGKNDIARRLCPAK